MWLYLVVFFVSLLILHLIVTRQDTKEPFTATPPPLDMDMVMDKYCKSRVALDRDEYMGPWDDTAVPFCAMSKCPDEQCKIVKLNAARSGYVWKNSTMTKKKEFNDELQREECVSNTNGTTVMCGDDADTVVESCQNLPQTCHKFDPVHKVYHSTEYNWFLNSSGSCVYRPVGNLSGEVITSPSDPMQCRQTRPPILDSHACDDGTILMQEYNASGAPVYLDARGEEVSTGDINDECDSCPVSTSGCQYFNRSGSSSRGGDWGCAQLKRMYGPPGSADIGDCVVRFDADGDAIHGIPYDDSDMEPGRCIEQCCSIGSACGARLDYYNIDNRADISLAANADGTVTCGRYEQDEVYNAVLNKVENDYIPRYKFGSMSPSEHSELGADFNDHPTGIELVQTTRCTGAGCDIIDITGYTVPEVCDTSCPAGSKRAAAGVPKCSMCDLNTHYYNGGGCVVHDGCTDINTKFVPNNLDRTQNDFGLFYNTTNNTDMSGNPACVPCETNTYLPARLISQYQTTDALRQTCISCDAGNEYYDFANDECAVCGSDAKLYTKPDGWRDCSNCPDPGANGFVTYDEVFEGGKCVKTCAADYFGGGAYSYSTYPVCVPNCGVNQKYDPSAEECVACPGGSEMFEGSHSNTSCDPCQIGFFRGDSAGLDTACEACPVYEYTDIEGNNQQLVGRTDTVGSRTNTDCYVTCIGDPANKAYYSAATLRYDVSLCGNRATECESSTEYATEVVAEAGQDLATGAIVSRVVPNVYDSMGSSGCVKNGAPDIEWSIVSTAQASRTDLMLHTVPQASGVDMKVICPDNTTLYDNDNCMCSNDPGTDEANGYVVTREDGVHRNSPFDSLDYRCVFECLPDDPAVPHVWMADDNDATSRTCVKACKNGSYASKNGALAPEDECTGCPIANSEVSLTPAMTENSNYFMGSPADANIRATTRAPSILSSPNGVTNCQVGISGPKAVTANDLCGTPPTGMQWEIGAANGGSVPANMNYVDTTNFKAYDRSNCIVNCESAYQIAGHDGSSTYLITDVFNYDSELSGHIAPRLTHYMDPKKTFHQFNSDNKPVVSSAKGVHENSYLPFGSTCPVDDSWALTGGAMRNQDGTNMADSMGLYQNRAAATDRDSSAFFAEVNNEPIYWCKDGHTLSHPEAGVTGPSVCCEAGTTAVWDAGGVRCVDDAVVYMRDGAVGENSEPTVFKPTLFTPPMGEEDHAKPVAKLDDEDISSTTKEAHTAAVITYEGTGTKNPDYVYGIDYHNEKGTVATDDSGSSGWKRVSRLFLGPSAGTGTNTIGDMFVCETKNAPGASDQGPYTRPVFNDSDPVEVACCEYYEYASPVEGQEVPSERLQFTKLADDTKICHRPDCDPTDGCRSIMVDSLVHPTYRASMGGASRYLISAKEHDLSTVRGAMTANYVLKPQYTDNAGAIQVAQLTADSTVDSSFISAGSGPIMLRLTVKSSGIGMVWALQYKELGEEDTMGTAPGWTDVVGTANCKVYEYVEPAVYSRTWLESHEAVGHENLRTITPGTFNSDSKVFVVLGTPGAASTNFRILTVNSCTASSIVVKFANLNSSEYNISQNKLELTNSSRNQMVMAMHVMDAPQSTCTDASTTINDRYGTSAHLMNDVGYFLYERECVVKCHQEDAGSTVYGVMETGGEVTCPTYQDQAITHIPTNGDNFVQITDSSHDMYGKPVGYAAICEERSTILEDYVQAGSTPMQCATFDSRGIDIMTDMASPVEVARRKYLCLNNMPAISIADFEASNVESLTNKAAISEASATYFENLICASNCPPAYEMVVTTDSDMTSKQHDPDAPGPSGQLGHKSATLTRKMYYTATGQCDTINTLTNLISSFDSGADNGGVYLDLNATPVDDTTGQFYTSDGVYTDAATRDVCTGAGYIVRNPEGGVGCCTNADDSLWIDTSGDAHCCPNGLRYVETGVANQGVCVAVSNCSETALIFADADSFDGISVGTGQRCYEQLTGASVGGALYSYINANWVSVGDATYRRPFVLQRAKSGTYKYWINTMRDPTGFEFATYDGGLGKAFAYMEWISTSSENFVKLVTNGYSIDMYLYKNTATSVVLPMLKVISGSGQEFRGYIHHDMMDSSDISNGNVVNEGTLIGTNYVQAVNLVGTGDGGGAEMVLSDTAERVHVEGLCKDAYRPNTVMDLDSPVPSELIAYGVTLASDLEIKIDGQECTYRCPSECGGGTNEFVYNPTTPAADLVDGCGNKNCQSCSIDAGSGVIGTCCTSDSSCSLSMCAPCDAGTVSC